MRTFVLFTTLLISLTAGAARYSNKQITRDSNYIQNLHVTQIGLDFRMCFAEARAMGNLSMCRSHRNKMISAYTKNQLASLRIEDSQMFTLKKVPLLFRGAFNTILLESEAKSVGENIKGWPEVRNTLYNNSLYIDDPMTSIEKAIKSFM